MRLFVAANDKDDPVGILACSLYTEIPDCGILDVLHISGPYKGEGIGTDLVKCCAAYMLDHGCTKMGVDVVTQNIKAIKFYKHTGAENYERYMDIFDGIGIDSLIMEEDPSFVLERNTETHQSLLGGQGEMQLNNIISKLKDKFGVEVEKVPQRIAYRETIKGSSDVQGKHKKQSGGAGQYGDVHIRFSPSEEEFEFVESLFGGSIPKNYVPAVEKGLRESLDKGPLAGCKVVNVKADLYDGSYHEVDSNEVSFKIAAALAFKKGIKEASPCLLEPIMHLEIIVPDEFMGDIMGDMNKRRGRILGSEPMDGNKQKVFAEAPQAELFDYAVKMRSMTQARGSFAMEFERYDPVPPNVAEKIIAAYEAEQAEN